MFTSPAPVKDSAMRHEIRYGKPWWEQVADYNEADQDDFIKGVYTGRFTHRVRQPQSYFLGLSSGYRAREFARPESHTGKQYGNTGLSK